MATDFPISTIAATRPHTLQQCRRAASVTRARTAVPNAGSSGPAEAPERHLVAPVG